MSISRNWDGCVVIPGGEVTIAVITFVFVIVLVVLGTALSISGADIGSILIGAGTLLGAVLGATVHRRRGSGGSNPV